MTALGDGAEGATMLMQTGYTAKDAVKEICKVNIYCGGRIDTTPV